MKYQSLGRLRWDIIENIPEDTYRYVAESVQSQLEAEMCSSLGIDFERVFCRFLYEKYPSKIARDCNYSYDAIRFCIEQVCSFLNYDVTEVKRLLDKQDKDERNQDYSWTIDRQKKNGESKRKPKQEIKTCEVEAMKYEQLLADRGRAKRFIDSRECGELLQAEDLSSIATELKMEEVNLRNVYLSFFNHMHPETPSFLNYLQNRFHLSRDQVLDCLAAIQPLIMENVPEEDDREPFLEVLAELEPDELEGLSVLYALAQQEWEAAGREGNLEYSENRRRSLIGSKENALRNLQQQLAWTVRQAEGFFNKVAAITHNEEPLLKHGSGNQDRWFIHLKPLDYVECAELKLKDLQPAETEAVNVELKDLPAQKNVQADKKESASETPSKQEGVVQKQIKGDAETEESPEAAQSDKNEESETPNAETETHENVRQSTEEKVKTASSEVPKTSNTSAIASEQLIPAEELAEYLPEKGTNVRIYLERSWVQAAATQDKLPEKENSYPEVEYWRVALSTEQGNEYGELFVWNEGTYSKNVSMMLTWLNKATPPGVAPFIQSTRVPGSNARIRWIRADLFDIAANDWSDEDEDFEAPAKKAAPALSYEIVSQQRTMENSDKPVALLSLFSTQMFQDLKAIHKMAKRNGQLEREGDLLYFNAGQIDRMVKTLMSIRRSESVNPKNLVHARLRSLREECANIGLGSLELILVKSIDANTAEYLVLADLPKAKVVWDGDRDIYILVRDGTVHNQEIDVDVKPPITNGTAPEEEIGMGEQEGDSEQVVPEPADVEGSHEEVRFQEEAEPADAGGDGAMAEEDIPYVPAEEIASEYLALVRTETKPRPSWRDRVRQFTSKTNGDISPDQHVQQAIKGHLRRKAEISRSRQEIEEQENLLKKRLEQLNDQKAKLNTEEEEIQAKLSTLNQYLSKKAK